MHKNSLNNIICHLSWLKKLCPYSYTSPQNHSWIFNTLWVIIFWVRVTCKMLNVNCIKIHSIFLSVTCHGLRNFAPTHTHPLKTIHEFLTPYELLFSELESLIKCWMWIGIKIHSIILSVTCHGLRNFAPTHTHPLKTIHEFLRPCDLLFSELESLIKMLNVTCIKIHSIILSVTCHGLRNFSPTHTHSLISIHEFSKPYKLLFFELESLLKCWMWLAYKFTQ